jgi:hypothetical protein
MVDTPLSPGRIKITPRIGLGLLLIFGGVMVMAFSPAIVTPGLEGLLGIDTIVGKNNVVHLQGGGYAYTNPSAFARWIASVVAIGISSCIGGLWLFCRAPKEYSKLERNSENQN